MADGSLRVFINPEMRLFIEAKSESEEARKMGNLPGWEEVENRMVVPQGYLRVSASHALTDDSKKE